MQETLYYIADKISEVLEQNIDHNTLLKVKDGFDENNGKDRQRDFWFISGGHRFYVSIQEVK